MSVKIDYDEIHPIKLGSIVTTISAHPWHNKWFGIVVDRHYCFHNSNRPVPTLPLIWKNLYGFSENELIQVIRNRWYYAILGMGFTSSTNGAVDIFLFLEQNLCLAK